MYHFANLTAAEQVLEQYLPSKISRPAYTTQHIQQFMDYLGNPQDSIRAIHIAGTSGKTSTAHYAAALLQQSGQKVGLLTSPHVDKITERMRINLQPLSDKTFCEELALFLELVDKSGIRLTYAELLYAFGYWEFARHEVSYMVIETGLGGLLDATNVISREDKVCIITDISLDHTNVLGDTIAKIAEQKAGIILRHNPVFTYNQAPAVMQQIHQAVSRNQADVHVISTNAPDMPKAYDFLPLFQRRNFTAAYQAVAFVTQRDSLGAISPQGQLLAAQITIPARMEVLQTGKYTMLLDGAHNSQKLQALRESIEAQFPGQSVAVLAAFIKSGGRDLVSLMKELKPLYNHVIFTMPHTAGEHHSWYDATELHAAATAAGIRSFEVIEDYQRAVITLLQRPEQIRVATGSLYAHSQLRGLIARYSS
jgi:dihydrofolate synthase/folylpolyglutamate synthase